MHERKDSVLERVIISMLSQTGLSAEISGSAWMHASTLTEVEDNSRWYAVQCQPHRERGAGAHLTNQGFFVFLPSCEKTSRHAHRFETVRAPFFPGYLFVRLDLTKDRWRSVNGTFGVVRLVMRGERPAAIARGIVEALQDACDESGVLRRQDGLTPGQSVRVLSGPFADLIGELDRLTDTGRVRVLLEIMGGRVPVFLPRESVLPVSSHL